jgi:hypothetical protein
MTKNPTDGPLETKSLVKRKGSNKVLKQSGYWALKRALMRYGSGELDRRTTVYKLFEAHRVALANGLGGQEVLSPQESIVIELIAKKKVLEETAYNHIVTMSSAVNKRTRGFYPLVREWSALGDSIVKSLAILGLQRRARPLPSLQEYMAQREAESAAEETPEKEGDADEHRPVDE